MLSHPSPRTPLGPPSDSPRIRLGFASGSRSHTLTRTPPSPPPLCADVVEALRISSYRCARHAARQSALMLAQVPFGAMALEEKNTISHRSRALASFVAYCKLHDEEILDAMNHYT
mgnify:CR=1 FL=1